jgi:6-phosphogluconolactonase
MNFVENNLDIRMFSPEIWARSCARIIQSAINDVILQKGSCSILLPGGESAKLLFTAWKKLPEFRLVSSLNIFFCDERCVEPESDDSNYKILLSILFNNTLPFGIKVHRIQGEFFDKEVASQKYSDLLPGIIDIAVFGVGEDGHIASLFPENPSMYESSKLVIPTTGPKAPFERISITPLVIKKIDKIFILVNGASKSTVLKQAVEDPNAYEYPVRLIIYGAWLIDSEIIIPNS